MKTSILRMISTRFAAPIMALLLSGGLASPAAASDLTDSVLFDFSNDWLNPTPFTLTYGEIGNNGLQGNNILSGTIGRDTQGVIDRDYVHFIVPVGYALSELKVGNQTTVGGNGSFIGLGAGISITVDPNTLNFSSSASGLLGYRVYTAADRGKNILDAMATAGNGSAGFTRPLQAGDYTLWIQELSSGGPYTYRFNLMLTPVPEPTAWLMLSAGLAWLGWRRRAS